MTPTKKPVTVCIGIVGSRRRHTADDLAYCTAALDVVVNELKCEDNYTLVSGGCKTGADSFAEIIAYNRGLTITIHNANWKKESKVAGFNRNSKIARQCNYLIALPSDDRTGGTEDTIKKAQALRKPVLIVDKFWIEEHSQ